MKAAVVGYGAMGKIISNLLGDELKVNVAPECEIKDLANTDGDFDVIIDFSNVANLDMIYNYVSKTKTPVIFATTGYSDAQLKKIEEHKKYC